MVVVNYSGKEINAKIVYYGPGLCGKTTNLERIYDAVPAVNKGKMISMKTKTDRTLFFDFLPLELGDIGGFRTRLMLYTVPGQVFYNATRKLVLKGVDAVVFVVDSERGKMGENQGSLENLRENLTSYGIDVEQIPIVFQYNKRDLPDVYTREELDRGLGRGSQPLVEAVAAKGEGVFETLRLVSKLLLTRLHQKMRPGVALPEAPAEQAAASSPASVAGMGASLHAPPFAAPPNFARGPSPAAMGAPPARAPALAPIPQTLPPVQAPAMRPAPPPSAPPAWREPAAPPPIATPPQPMTTSPPPVPFFETPAWAERPPVAPTPMTAPPMTAPAASEAFLASAAAPMAPHEAPHAQPLEILRLDTDEPRQSSRRIVVPVEIDAADLEDGEPIELVLRLEVKRDRLRAS